MQIKPTSLLAGIIRHYLVIESDRRAVMRIFSDGNTGIVFNFGDSLSFENEPGTLPDSFIYGQLDRFRNVSGHGRIRLLIAVLKPFGAAALFRMPASELRNRIVGCDEMWGSHAAVLHDEMDSSNSWHERIAAIERFLTVQMRVAGNDKTLVTHCIQAIHMHNGLLPVYRLTEWSGASERQLQRQFEAHIGISPKRYAGIIRMQYALKMLRQMPAHDSVAGIACASGFFDQAHLIREMKNLSGLTPGQYLSPDNLLAANLIQLGP